MNVLATATRMLRRVLDLALVLLIAAALAGVFFGRILPMLGPTTLVVRGPSMAPAIPLGALVVTTPVEAAALAVGDVVSVRVGPEQAVFTHRIVRVVARQGEIWIETRGDANDAPDPAIVPASSVVGRVALTVPVLGYLVVLLSSLSGVLLLIGLAGVLLLGAWILESVELDEQEEPAQEVALEAPPARPRVAAARRRVAAAHRGTGT
jgi:signal peptidase